MMKEIKSETKLILRFILGVLKTPFVLVLALFGKRSFKEVLLPIVELYEGIIEPRFTFGICVFLIFSFIVSLFLDSSVIDMLVLYPTDFLGAGAYSLITHGFLHAGLGHLFSNLLMIYVFGRLVETELGPQKTMSIYFFGLVFAALFSSVVNIMQGVSVGAVGASGAAMALVGAGLLFRPLSISYVALIPLPVFVIGWLAIISDVTGILNASQDGIGYFAHLGGFISAFIMLLILKEREQLFKGLLINGALGVLFLVVLYLI